MHVLAPNQIVEIYPYSFGDLQRDNPNTSFPADPTEQTLAEWNVFPVIYKSAPDYNPATHNLTEGDPTLIDDQWEMTWAVTPATSGQIAKRTAAKETEVRQQRDRLLSYCDWTQLPDAPVSPAPWATYRQELRDVTAQAGFPWDVVWGDAPQASGSNAQASEANSIASGTSATAFNAGAIATGQSSTASGINSQASGTSSFASPEEYVEYPDASIIINTSIE